jgi:hypothetical protein
LNPPGRLSQPGGNYFRQAAEEVTDMNQADPNYRRTAAEVPIEDDYVADVAAQLDGLLAPLESFVDDLRRQDHWQANLGTGGMAAMLVLADRVLAVERALEASLDAGVDEEKDDDDDDDDDDENQ